MMRTPWGANETFGEWRVRHNRLARKVLADHGAEEMPQAALRRQFRWANTAMARFAKDFAEPSHSQIMAAVGDLGAHSLLHA